MHMQEPSNNHGGRRENAGRLKDSGDRTGHLNMRVPMKKKSAWVRQAQSEGLTLSKYVERQCDDGLGN